MSYETAAREERSAISMTKYPGSEPSSDAPLLVALNSINEHISELDQAIDTAFKKLDHLILHVPEPEDRDAIQLARQAHSDTVSRVETLDGRIQDSTTRLQRLLKLIEA